MPEDLKANMWDVIENAVKQIALSRKVTEISDDSVEDFDEELNRLCEKWHTKFKDMTIQELSVWLIADIIDMKGDFDGE